MNKKAIMIVGVIVGLLVIGGGAFAYSNNQSDKKEQDRMAMEKKAEDEAMTKKDEDAAMEKEKMAKEDGTASTAEVMVKEEAMAKAGAYVNLADYNKDPSVYADSKVVYFFHAAWCPICRGIDAEISADLTKIPVGVTFVKTDFDSSTDLRQKYGVTTQYTFVQVDSSGNETAQWSATSLDKAIAGIKS